MRIAIAFFTLLTLSSCLVSKKKFDLQEAMASKLGADLNDCNQKLALTENELEDLKKNHDLLSKKYNTLNGDQDALKAKQDKLNKDYELAQKQYDDLRKRMDDIGKSSSSEKEKLRIALMEKEKALEEREKRIKDLESLIARKDEAVSALRKKIADALMGFNSSELTVTEKNGKVYVSLSDKLLFKTGSTAVDEKGKQAIVKLAEVLNKQPEIDILVEGHTDSKEYINPKGEIKNNWDLSVMRATSVTQILLNDGAVDAKRITPTGHAAIFPVESNETAEGRAKNRRIEIVLSPDLKEIFKILDNSNQ